jgi:hypothetical protein
MSGFVVMTTFCGDGVVLGAVFTAAPVASLSSCVLLSVDAPDVCDCDVLAGDGCDVLAGGGGVVLGLIDS